MSEEFSFEVKPESIEELKKAINYDELNEISKRFNNGTETENDIINHCRNYGIEFENGNQLFVVEKKYFDKVVDLYQKEKEKNKDIERYKRIANKKLDDIEEFRKNECNHRCIKDAELKEFKEYIFNNYISKDKIREKIKEYEDFYKEYPIEFRKYKMRPIIVVLKELLKEK